MNVLTEGHKYELRNFENANNTQTVQFIEKKAEEEELVLINDGTTNEEVLGMMINRLTYLYNKLPSNETSNAINYITLALKELNARTNDRVARGVEGTHKS